MVAVSVEDELAAAVARVCEDCGRPFLTVEAYGGHHCEGVREA